MITLINPPFSSQNADYFFYIGNPYPHTALAYLAGYLEKRNVKVDIIDSKFDRLNFEQISNSAKTNNNNIIGITSTTSEINQTHLLIDQIRKKINDAFIILGGFHACALPYETLKNNPSLDAVAFGEGEEILYQLSICENVNDALPEIAGLFYREKGGGIKKNNGKAVSPTLAGYGVAAFQHWPKAKNFYLMTHRGCPYKCSFCFRTLGNRVRLRNVEDVMQDLLYLAGINGEVNLSFSDPTFGINRSHTEEILHQIIREKLSNRFLWSCTTRVDVMDASLLRLMKEAGCGRVGLGIESGSDRILKLTGKNTKLSQARKVTDLAKKLGIRVAGFYIFGHINETKEEIKQTIQTIWKINTDEVYIGIMVPWPGTEVYKLAKANRGGYSLLSEDYSKFDKYFGQVMRFDNFSLKYLDLMRIIAFLKLYIYNYRFYDLYNFIKTHYKEAFKKLKQLLKVN